MKKVEQGMVTLRTIRNFQKTVLSYFHVHGRTLPWRNVTDPYWVMVSEIMLQQTQVVRVIDKYLLFIKCFPTVFDLAKASFGDVLRMWQGLGYNRRAKFLHQTARMIVGRYQGRVPFTVEELDEFPGIGKDTAAAICVYAYNMPMVFVETNIRTVYIHHFFSNTALPVSDRELVSIIEMTLYKENPRLWYSALMDYGSMLKASVGNKSRLSLRYAKQKKFIGSDREARGVLLRALLQERRVSVKRAAEVVGVTRVQRIISGLLKDGLVRKKDRFLILSE